MTVDYRVGDTREVVASLPDGSVSLVASSPPFIALRSYLPDGHPMKAAEIGSEPDPATFLDTLLALTAEWGRVLAPWGSIAIELGDTYAGGSAQGTDQRGSDRYPNGRGQEGLIQAHTKSCGEWPRAKSLALIPQLYATSLAYGRNLLTGEPSPAGQWLVRNVIVWHRPNPAVGKLGDKVRPSTSYITVATRSPKRWFDLDAVRTTPVTNLPVAQGNNTKGSDAQSFRFGERVNSNAAGAPPLDCWFDEHDTWTLTTQPSSLAHYAMWPAKLAERLILMMCPAEVCAVCQEPRRRLVRATAYESARVIVARPIESLGGGHRADRPRAAPTALGWSDCGCMATCPTCNGKGMWDAGETIRRCQTCNLTGKVAGANYRPGVVLDPFAGTGTTLAVADLHGRDAIGIDIDSRNQALYPKRRDECARALFGAKPQMEGQASLW